MNKKGNIIILSLIIISVIAIFIYNNTSNISSSRCLGGKEEKRSFVSHTNQSYTNDSMKFDFKSFNGKWSFFELDLNEGSKIIIDDNSKIEKEKMYLVLLTSDYDIVSQKELNGEENLEFLCPKDQKYFLRIVGKRASGHFEVKINSDNQYKATYKDFFG